jgi:hypothetical protein
MEGHTYQTINDATKSMELQHNDSHHDERIHRIICVYAGWSFDIFWSDLKENTGKFSLIHPDFKRFKDKMIKSKM